MTTKFLTIKFAKFPNFIVMEFLRKKNSVLPLQNANFINIVVSASLTNGTYFTRLFRGFEKGLADRGGWSEEVLHVPEIQASFLYPFSYAFLGEGGHISGGFFGSVCRSFKV